MRFRLAVTVVFTIVFLAAQTWGAAKARGKTGDNPANSLETQIQDLTKKVAAIEQLLTLHEINGDASVATVFIEQWVSLSCQNKRLEVQQLAGEIATKALLDKIETNCHETKKVEAASKFSSPVTVQNPKTPDPLASVPNVSTSTPTIEVGVKKANKRQSDMPIAHAQVDPLQSVDSKPGRKSDSVSKDSPTTTPAIIVVSPLQITFDPLEPGSTEDKNFSLTNKQGIIRVERPLVKSCEAAGKNCTAESDNFLVMMQDTCPNVFGNGDHCDYTVIFAPKENARLFAQVVIPVKDANTGEDKPQVVDLIGEGRVANVAKLNTGTSNPVFRSVAGFDITGASSADTEQKVFVEFDLAAPFGPAGQVRTCILKGKNPEHVQVKNKKNEEDCAPDSIRIQPRVDPLNRGLWWYFNPRITSLPQAASPIANLNVQGLTDFFGSKKTDLVQGVDVSGGLEYMFVKPRHGLPFLSSYTNAHTRLAMAFVSGIGFTSPFSTPGTSPTVFTLDPKSQLRHQFQTVDPATGNPIDIPSNFTNIAFIDRERSRFFRKYYGGLRLKSYFFTDLVDDGCDPGYKFGKCEALMNIFPGTIDLTFGQDEQVTGGHLSKWIFRLDAVYPLPFLLGATVFGSVNTGIQKNHSANPLILPPTSNTALNDPSVFIVNLDPRNRDFYRIGFGFDLLQLFRKKTPTNSVQPSPATKQPSDAAPLKDSGKRDNADPPALPSTL